MMPHAAPLDEEDDDPTIAGSGAAAAAAQDLAGKKGNILPLWGNANTLNLNPLILTNIQNSPYFKVQCFSLKTYHEVVDEIYYKVAHLEPWERGDWKYYCPIPSLFTTLSLFRFAQDLRSDGHVWRRPWRGRRRHRLLSLLPPPQAGHTQTHP